MTGGRADGRDTLYYDGACGLCLRSVRILRWLDWLHRLGFQDMTGAPEEELPVAPERALEGLPMRTRHGRILVGFPAMRRALLQTPLGALPALLLFLPGVSHLGARVYAFVAANRRREGLACEVCETDPHAPGSESA